jgi:uncharacterized membrane protein YhfC
LEWRLFWIGMATFIASYIIQYFGVGYLSFLSSSKILINMSYSGQMVFKAVFLGLSAGIVEEFARYAFYRWWAKDARSWESGLLMGSGHGGMEAIFVGAIALYLFINMLYLNKVTDLTTLGVSAENLEQVLADIQAYWSPPWFQSLLPVLESLLVLPMQIALSVIVLQTFTRKQVRWVWMAIGFHAAVNGTTIYASYLGARSFVIEGIVGAVALISILFIFRLRKPSSLTDKQINPVN